MTIFKENLLVCFLKMIKLLSILEIERFRGCEEVKTLLQVTMKEPKGSVFWWWCWYSSSNQSEIFEIMLEAFRTSEEFRKLVMIICDFTFSTVECERDFSWLQHLLCDQYLQRWLQLAFLQKILNPFQNRSTLPKLPVNVSDSEAGESNQEVINLINGSSRKWKKTKFLSNPERVPPVLN